MHLQDVLAHLPEPTKGPAVRTNSKDIAATTSATEAKGGQEIQNAPDNSSSQRPGHGTEVRVADSITTATLIIAAASAHTFWQNLKVTCHV
jgi:hypothetical protein